MPGSTPLDFVLTTDAASAQAFLDSRGWLEPGERVESLSKAGEGNMNRTLRVHTSGRSLVLKQSFPYCERFPEIPAPIERIDAEVAFYHVARRDPRLAAHMPEIQAYAPEVHLAMIEDLGEGSDLRSIYTGDALEPGELATLGALARALHELALSPTEAKALRNTAMRELNHEHIFDIPLRPENGIDLDATTPGLAGLAAATRRDRAYVEGVLALGEIYLHAEGPALLHGDYYPGSFLRTGRGLMIIDPEFAFPGPPEFDLSVLAAHLILAGGEPDAIVGDVLDAYAAPIDRPLLEGFAACELMRRTFGVSRLDLPVDLAGKQAWIERSRAWVHAWRGASR